jgi:predicted FMN-binding regulatory protein PaiB
VIYCKVRYIDDPEQVWLLLDEFTKVFEGRDGWKLPQSEDYKALTTYLRLFEVEVVSIEAKFKFSQNKSSEDREKVMMSLDKCGQKKVADFMRSVNKVEK